MQAFLDGARAAFGDLRLPLQERDATETAAVEVTLEQLDRALAAAALRESIADPAAIAAATETAAHRLETLIPPEWLEAGGDADFDVVASLLDQMIAAVAAGQYQQAERHEVHHPCGYEPGQHGRWPSMIVPRRCAWRRAARERAGAAPRPTHLLYLERFPDPVSRAGTALEAVTIGVRSSAG